MKTKQILVYGFLVVMLAFGACSKGSGLGSSAVKWGDWTQTAYLGTDERVSKNDPSHTEQRLTGTDRFTFAPANNTSYRISKGTEKGPVVRIPDFYRPDADREFMPVTEIGNGINGEGSNAFGGHSDRYTASPNRDLTSVYIPASVTYISDYAFHYCHTLKNVTFASGSQLQNIGKCAFFYCESLTSITIPNSVTSIGEEVFKYCTNLTSVTFQGTIPSSGLDELIGDLRGKYLAEGIGTYTRSNGSDTWTKQ